MVWSECSTICNNIQSAIIQDVNLNLMTTVQHANTTNESAICKSREFGINEGCIELVVWVSDHVEDLALGAQEVKGAPIKALHRHNI